MAKIVGVCISDRKGVSKKNVGCAYLEIAKGLKNDAHSGFGHRQVSLLAKESIDRFVTLTASKMREKCYELQEGSFAENLTTEGIDLKSLPIGTELKIGETVRLRITQIGKDCHAKPARPAAHSGEPRPSGRGDRSGGCAIFRKIGDCIMPSEGIFAEVLQSGDVKIGDKIEIRKI